MRKAGDVVWVETTSNTIERWSTRMTRQLYCVCTQIQSLESRAREYEEGLMNVEERARQCKHRHPPLPYPSSHSDHCTRRTSPFLSFFQSMTSRHKPLRVCTHTLNWEIPPSSSPTAPPALARVAPRFSSKQGKST
jgi:hypothetical protein